MKKVTIYTTAHKRPEFIKMQYDCLKKFVKDEYEFIVLNNAIDSRFKRKDISNICEKLNIKSIEIKKDKKFNTIGGEKAISWFGNYNNPNVACAYPMKYVWENICNYNKDNIIVFLDSDMWICRDINFNEEIKTYDSSFVTMYKGVEQGRKKASVEYICNFLLIFDVKNINNIKDMNWDCGVTDKGEINGHKVDVGGFTYYWLKQNKITQKRISEYAILDYKIKENGNILLECSQDGCFRYFLEYNYKNKNITDYYSTENLWEKDDTPLPHITKENEQVMKEKIIKYFEKYILNKHEKFPAPIFIGFIEFETFNSTPNPFIIHFKGGSNYLKRPEEYFKIKTQFIKNLLKI